jgi:FkbM family methyltransferase
VEKTGLRKFKTRHFRFEKTLRDGNVVVYRPQDQCVIDEVYFRQVYTRGGWLADGQIVVDLGGHIGVFTLQAAAAVGEKGRVIVCEPGPENAALLRENVRRNGLRNVTLLECAVSDKDGVVDLYVPASSDPSQNPIANSLFAAPGRKAVPVRARSLDEIVAAEKVPHIDLLKIDVEGAEGLVLSGGKKALAMTRRLVVEVHGDKAKAEAMARDLSSAGFDCRLQLDGSSPIVEGERRPS